MAEPTQPPSGTVNSPEAPTSVSPLFDDSDADTTFKSSDGVVFKMHSKHLQTASAVLSPGPAMDLMEAVSLTETSEVLEILFQFIRPPLEDSGYRQPSVMKMEPNLFFRVAEAAEKYVVFGAMNMFVMWMHYNVENHPLMILNHTTKHGYTELSDIAAEISVRCPLVDAGRQLTHPGISSKWLVYYGYWMQLRDVLENEPLNNCPVARVCRSEVLCALGKNPKSFSDLPPPPEFVTCPNRKCPCPCDVYPEAWIDKLSKKRDEIPKFSSISLEG